jgi:hypothetical protein
VITLVEDNNVCKECGKKVGIWYTADSIGNAFCNKKCKKEFEKKNPIKEEPKKEEIKEKVKIADSKILVEEIEYKRTCKECGKVWHSLKKREEEIKKLQNAASYQSALSYCTCSPLMYGAAAQYDRNWASAQKDLDSLMSCPVCGSRNYEEKEIMFERYEDKKNKK